MPSVVFVLYIVSNRHWRSKKDLRGRTKIIAGSSRKIHHHHSHHHHHHLLLYPVHRQSIQICRNNRTPKSHQCLFTRPLAAKQFSFILKKAVVKMLSHKYVEN